MPGLRHLKRLFHCQGTFVHEVHLSWNLSQYLQQVNLGLAITLQKNCLFYVTVKGQE